MSNEFNQITDSMKNVLAWWLLGLCYLATQPTLLAQADYTLTAEEQAVDGVPGTTTYRFYVDVENPDA